MWTGERGHSTWFSDMPEVNAITNFKGIPFKNGFPDFSEWSVNKAFIRMTGVDDLDFAQADKILARVRGFKNQTAAMAWRKENNLTWHHVEDGETMLLVPSALHGNVPHIGGVSVAGKVLP